MGREREKKILDLNSVHTRPVEGNSEKKKAKKFKELKKLFSALFQPKRDQTDGEREKKILDPNSVYTRPEQENSEKNRKKIKKIKNLFMALFLAKTG